METLTRDLIESHMMSLIDVFKEESRWEWMLSEIGVGITSKRPPEFDEPRFNTREGAILNAFAWIASVAPELEKAAVAEAREGMRYRAMRGANATS